MTELRETESTLKAVLDDRHLRQAAAKLSEPAFAAVWNNSEDAVYDDVPLNDYGYPINDYTEERDRWLGDLTLDDIWAELKSRQDS